MTKHEFYKLQIARISSRTWYIHYLTGILFFAFVLATLCLMQKIHTASSPCIVAVGYIRYKTVPNECSVTKKIVPGLKRSAHGYMDTYKDNQM